jgi:molybdopterin molybdotransferase
MGLDSTDRMPCRSVDDATGWIDSRIAPLPPEEVAAPDALGRVLATDAVSTVAFPPFDRAAIDGVALRADETVGAGAYNPLSFRLCDGAATLPMGAAARVRAGDRLPEGADTVAPPEFAQPGAAGMVDLIEAVPADNEVERRASHFARDAVLVPAGRCIRPPERGLLALGGVDRITVVRRPRVAIILAGADMDAGLLQPLIERDGGRVVDVRRAARADIRQALSAADADAVLVTGGPDRGRDREMAVALAASGELAIAEVALSPGGAVLGRTAGGAWAFSLPRAPSSCYWTYEILVGRAIRRLAGHSPDLPFRTGEMTLARKIVSAIGVTEICPVRRLGDGSVDPLSGYARANLRAVTQADGFVVVAEGSEGMPAGSVVSVYLFGDCHAWSACSPSRDVAP